MERFFFFCLESFASFFSLGSNEHGMKRQKNNSTRFLFYLNSQRDPYMIIENLERGNKSPYEQHWEAGRERAAPGPVSMRTTKELMLVHNGVISAMLARPDWQVSEGRTKVMTGRHEGNYSRLTAFPNLKEGCKPNPAHDGGTLYSCWLSRL